MAGTKKNHETEGQHSLQVQAGTGTRLPLLLEVKEAAAEMRTSPATIYRLINAGVLPVLKLGRLKVPYKALVDFVDRYVGHDLTNPNSIHLLSLADYKSVAE